MYAEVNLTFPRKGKGQHSSHQFYRPNFMVLCLMIQVKTIFKGFFRLKAWRNLVQKTETIGISFSFPDQMVKTGLGPA